jgi:hypothetical protein
VYQTVLSPSTKKPLFLESDRTSFPYNTISIVKVGSNSSIRTMTPSGLCSNGWDTPLQYGETYQLSLGMVFLEEQSAEASKVASIHSGH